MGYACHINRFSIKNATSVNICVLELFNNFAPNYLFRR